MAMNPFSRRMCTVFLQPRWEGLPNRAIQCSTVLMPTPVDDSNGMSVCSNFALCEKSAEGSLSPLPYFRIRSVLEGLGAKGTVD